MPVAQAAEDGEAKRGSKSREVRQAQPATQGRAEDEMFAKSPYVKYFQSRKYDTSDAARNASRRREERRGSPANDKSLRGSRVQELAEIPKPTEDRSLAGGTIQDKKESSQVKTPDSSTPIICAGSLDPEYPDERPQNRLIQRSLRSQELSTIADGEEEVSGK
jgi:hypothetical protein